MKTQITTIAIALVATIAIAANANAQQTAAMPQAQFAQQQVLPVVQPPIRQNKFYFGMQVELMRGYAGTTLRIVSVTPGSPAQMAGLEVGDEIRTVNNRGFQNASNSFNAVSMMNQFVNSSPVGGGPAPAVAAYTVMPLPSPQPVARMIVRNVRTGQDVQVIVRPRVAGGYPGTGIAPAAAAPATQW